VEVELGSAEGTHNRVKDTELAGREGSDHDATGGEALSAELDNTSLLGDVDEARDDATAAAGASLVDLGEKRVGGVRDDGSHDTGDDTRGERDGDVGATAALGGRRLHVVVDCLGSGTLD